MREKGDKLERHQLLQGEQSPAHCSVMMLCIVFMSMYCAVVYPSLIDFVYVALTFNAAAAHAVHCCSAIVPTLLIEAE